MRAEGRPKQPIRYVQREIPASFSFCSLEFEQNVRNIAKHYIQDIRKEKKRRRAIHFVTI